MLIVALGWFFSYVFDNPSILVIAVILSIAMNVGGYWFSDKIVLSLSGARLVNSEEHKDLWNIVENLSITAGLPMPKLYCIDDSVPNAFATGRNKEHAAVAVTTGLLSLLERSELEGVIAHELSHVGNKDMLLSTIVVVLVGFITLLSDFFLRMNYLGGRRDKNSGNVGLVLMLVGVLLAILSPLIATLIQLAISRKREYLADASGVLLTRYPDGLAKALEKIGAVGGKMHRANHATAHLFISNPFGSVKERQSFFTRIWSTHPPIEERVKILREMNK